MSHLFTQMPDIALTTDSKDMLQLSPIHSWTTLRLQYNWLRLQQQMRQWREPKKKHECQRIYEHINIQPFYGPFLGPPGWAGARRELLDFMVQGKINKGRHTDHPEGRHSIQTNQCPPPPSPSTNANSPFPPWPQQLSAKWPQIPKFVEITPNILNTEYLLVLSIKYIWLYSIMSMSRESIMLKKSSSNWLWSPYVIGQTIIFSSCSFFLSSSIFLFPRLISAAAHWMSTILPHMVWP